MMCKVCEGTGKIQVSDTDYDTCHHCNGIGLVGSSHSAAYTQAEILSFGDFIMRLPKDNKEFVRKTVLEKGHITITDIFKHWKTTKA